MFGRVAAESAGWTTRRRRGFAAALAGVGALVLAASTSAWTASAAPTADGASAARVTSSVTEAADTPVELGLPWRETLDARWTWEHAEPLPSTTRTLTVTIPPELFDFDAPLDAVIVGAQRDPVTVISADAATRTVSVDIPEGYFDTAAPSMTSGSPRWSLGLRTSRPQPAGMHIPSYQAPDASSPSGYSGGYSSSGYVSIGFDPGPPGATSHSRTVEKSGALRYNYSRYFWVDPESEITVHGSDTLTVTGAPVLLDGSWGTMTSWEGGSIGVGPATPVDAESPGSGVSVPMPEEATLAGLLDRSTTLRVPYTSDAGYVDIGMPLTVVHTASSGPGVTTKIAGQDRYWGSVAYNRELFGLDSTEHPPVVLTSGEKFADSLSAAAATAHVDGSLLLVNPQYGAGYLTGDEAARLQPASVVTVGGAASVSDQAAQDVATEAGTASPLRVGGQDRYEVSRNTARQFWPDGAATVFVATGQTFPDALAAVPAADSQQAPVLLVPGAQSALDQSTLATLAGLKASRIVVVGGPVSVTPGIEKQLRGLYPGGVERITGADRYEVSAAVNTRFFPTAQEAFVATGGTFADALTGGVLAASKHAPLLLVRPDCVPASAHAALVAWNVQRTTLLGGPDSLGAPIENLIPCS